jgi:predicted transcriptional regulator of viral defense system
MLFKANEYIPTEFDYVYLMDRLSAYSDPWGRVRRMLKTGEIVRVKKGLYVPGKEYGTQYSNIVLANLIFGPSYVSYAAALAHYGLIPELPASVWSVTPARKKSFATPVGSFDYFFQNINLYAAGMTRVQIEGEKFALIATPEKALFDFVKFRLGNSSKTVAPTADLLIEDLRLDEDSLKRLSVGKLEELSLVSKTKLGIELATCLRKLK